MMANIAMKIINTVLKTVDLAMKGMFKNEEKIRKTILVATLPMTKESDELNILFDDALSLFEFFI